VPSDIMGRGDEELGGILVRAFFHTLGEVKPLPDAIIFFNSGVKLVVEGSPVVEDLQALKTRGIEILACGKISRAGQDSGGRIPALRTAAVGTG